MKQETKNCQNCKNDFTIEPNDFTFYDKIKVPAPTWCWLCRAQRRFAWRNEKNIYKRKCDFSGKDFFSPYSPDKPYKVYDNSVWYSDEWDAMSYGKDYDFSRPFFSQFFELLQEVPRTGQSVEKMVNSPYCNNANSLKNCYLLFSAGYSEDCAYGSGVDNSKDSFDNLFIEKCELVYDNFWLNRCNRTFFSSRCEDCINVYFSKNLRNCSDCFGCANLRNKSYCIFNKQHSKENYEEKVKEFLNGSYSSIEEVKKKATGFWLQFPNKFMDGARNESVTGDYIYNSKNISNSYLIKGGENLKYCQYLHFLPNKDCFDHSIWGDNNNLTYECEECGLGTYNLKFCSFCWGNVSDLEYCYNCRSSSNLFGCVGLRNKQYCILNKQYTKESFEKFRSQIIEHMNNMPYIDKKGMVYKYGEFFPSEFIPFAYNETIVQEHFPLTKEQAIDKGYSWKDTEKRQLTITMTNDQLPDHIKDVKDNIIDQIIECANASSKISKGNLGGQASQCTTAFKIIQAELDFYRKMNLPLPRLCPNCRHYQRLKQRNPLKLWKRQCQCAGTQSDNGIYQNTITHTHNQNRCENEFETTYSPDRPEIVYCEKCYQAEVV